MNLSHRLQISYYEVITPINEPHKVYLVRHRETGRFYVKKVLDVYSADVYKDLKDHPVRGIPRIIDCWEEETRLVVIEEFISGTTLRDKIESTAPSADAENVGACADESDILTQEKIGQYMIGLCEILERLHSHKPPLIHRDLKPSNIIITSCDNVMLLDFNAAKFHSGEAGRESDTRLLGTAGYAAPEQYGFGESSSQTDLYSVGKILQECVAALPSESHIFDAVIKKCTQIDPAKRYPSAGALRAALLQCLGRSDRPDISGPVVNKYLPPGFRTLNPWKMLIASVVYLFIIQVSFSLKVQNSSGLELWLERIIILLLALMNILIGSNYLGIHRHLPFQKSDKRWLRVTGVVLTMCGLTILFFIILIFFIGMFFAQQ